MDQMRKSVGLSFQLFHHMIFDTIAASSESSKNSVRIALLLTAISIPLMLGLALLKDSRLLDRAAGFLQPVMQRLKLSNLVAARGYNRIPSAEKLGAL